MSARPKRAPIPASTKHLLNEQCGTACAICRETKTSMLEIHHIDGDVKNPELGNLLILCASCHAEFSRGTKSEADAKMFKRMAETGHLLPRRDARTSSADVVNHGPNHGVMGQQVYVEKYVTEVKGESGPHIRPGTIGASVVEHNYVEYLVATNLKWRRRLREHPEPMSRGISSGRVDPISCGGMRRMQRHRQPTVSTTTARERAPR